MHVAILLYDGFTALDAVGPYEVLSCLSDVRVQFIAETAGPKRADTQALALVADASLGEVPHPDILLIPGGNAGTVAAAKNESILAWVRQAHATSRLTTSVCTGAFVLGAAGVLQDRRATTYWSISAAAVGGHLCRATLCAGWKNSHRGRRFGRDRYGPLSRQPLDRCSDGSGYSTRLGV